MRVKRICLVTLLVAALILTGCAMRTVDQMYCLPKRSEDHNNLQAAVDAAMVGLEYCAPLSGENQQTLQSADLDGDGNDEYLLYAKGSSEMPLRIMIFDEIGDSFSHITTIECNGLAFDTVEYVQMDTCKGFEIVVGCQVSEQQLRSVSIYQYTNQQIQRFHQTGYTKFMPVDLNEDGIVELFVLRPGATDTEYGVAELYSVIDGSVQRSNEVNMSAPSDKLKRMILGNLNDGKQAVFTACSIEDTALITDIFTIQDSRLVNVSLSNESGTSVKTLRNYYVFAEDIDQDGVVELPYLIPTSNSNAGVADERHDLIRWYGMNSDGSAADKLFSYHNFAGGWYLVLDSRWAGELTVTQTGNCYDFYVRSNKVFSVFALTGPNRNEEATNDGRFSLIKNDSVVYCAVVYEDAQQYEITQESITKSFRLIETKWNTGET